MAGETSPSNSASSSARSGARTQAPAQQATLAEVARKLKADVARLSAPPRGDRPVTLGIGEPFTTTVTVSLILALILSSPLLLLQAYGFLTPAVEARPAPPHCGRLILAVPVLFVGGVAFGYFAVLPAAMRFFQNFNNNQFNVLVQASQYYKFAATLLLAMGLLFQIPLAILAATRSGLVSVRRVAPQPRLRHGAMRARSRTAARGPDHHAARNRAPVPTVRGQPASSQHRRTTRPPCTELPVRHRRRKLELRVGSASREPRAATVRQPGSAGLAASLSHGPDQITVLEAGALPTADSRCGDSSWPCPFIVSSATLVGSHRAAAGRATS